MSLYVIGDLHLPFGIDKPMDIFGLQWEGYTEKLKQNWIENVKPEDTVILAGDFSWATYLEETYKDFELINNLPGRKIMLKGNHDYWWTTIKAMKRYLEENNFVNIDFLHNNSYFRTLFYHRVGPIVSILIGWYRPGNKYFIIRKDIMIIYF